MLVLLTTSGRSANLVAGGQGGPRGRPGRVGDDGPGAEPVADLADEVLAIDVPSTTAVQEAHLVAVHAVCAALERHLALPAVPELAEVV